MGPSWPRGQEAWGNEKVTIKGENNNSGWVIILYDIWNEDEEWDYLQQTLDEIYFADTGQYWYHLY